MIFLDSSFLIALADSDDQFHNGAASLMPRLRGAKAITEMVLSESVTGVGARLGGKAAREVFENLLYDPSVSVFFANKKLLERALPIFVKYGGAVSFSDALSIRIMLDHKMREVASFDRDFDRVEGIIRLS